jgi:hypothetical protein
MVTEAELRSFLAMAASVSGSVGAYTFSRNRGGMFIRDRVAPAQPDTLKQITARARLVTLTRRWAATLTPAERASWRPYAAGVPLVDRLGAKRHRTGFQHFMRSNYVRVIAGLATIDTAPLIHNLSEFTAMPATIDAAGARAILKLWFDDGDAWVHLIASRIYAYTTVALPATVNSLRPPRSFRGAKSPFAGIPATFPIGSAAAAGEHVFIRVQVQPPDGRLSYPQTGMVVVNP